MPPEVNTVYDHIAPHFSSTRYKPWPLVSEFLQNIPTGWVGLDSGTGNGKYLGLPTNLPGKIWTIGLDRSQSLLTLARSAGESDKIREVVRGDVLENGWRRGAFDYAISIATIHHLATTERRVAGVKRLIDSVSPRHGRILIYVWAIEQDEKSKRVIPVPAREGLYADADGERFSSGQGQDVFVPWVLCSDNARPKVQSQNVPPDAIRRYYHMFSKDELRGLVHSATQELGLKVGPRPSNETEVKCTEGVEIVVSGWERSNYYIELRRWQR